MMAAAAGAASAPPIVHAIGGSLGSALALVLFYPLERARIELQAQASAVPLAPPLSTSPQQRELHLAPQGHTQGDVENSIGVAPSSSSTASRNLSCGAVVDDASWAYCLEDDVGTDPSDRLDSDRTRAITAAEDGAAEAAAVSVPPVPPPWARSSLVRCLLDLHARGALYQGVTPIMTTIFTSQFIFFFMQAYVKRVMDVTRFLGGALSTQKQQQQYHPALLSLVSSCIAGVGNVVLTNPLWVTNMAIVTGETQTQNLVTELVRIYRTRGVSHLWDGTSASIWLVSNPIIQFFCYEQLKKARLAALLGRSGADGATSPAALGALEAFLFAALAKAVATITTYPLQLAQTLLRLGDDDPRREGDGGESKTGGADAAATAVTRRHVPHRRYTGTVDCLVGLYRTDKGGLAAWYTGMRAKLLQTVLTAAFTFLTYEQILGAVQRVVSARGRVAAAAAASSVTPGVP